MLTTINGGESGNSFKCDTVSTVTPAGSAALCNLSTVARTYEALCIAQPPYRRSSRKLPLPILVFAVF